MKGYILDTNAISDWLDETKPRHVTVSRRANKAANEQSIIVTSAVVLGEIEYGIAATGKAITQALKDLRAQVVAQFVHGRLLLGVTKTTASIYGDLRAKLFGRFAPGDKRTKALRPEQLTCPITSQILGIQENDLWIAAQAIERNVVLVTNDAMTRIQEVASELRVEDWATEQE